MAITPGLDYTDKDFDSLRARLFNLISSAMPLWTDREVANFGNILVECFAFIGDVVLYYQDRQAAESRITTAQLRVSLLALSKLLGYKPVGATAATTQMTFSLAAPPIGNVTINAGDRFATQRVTEPVSFQALNTVVLAAGANPPTVIFEVEHSENSVEAFQSTELPNQEVQLNDVPFLDGSLTVVAGDGAYTIVETFLESTATDRHVTVQVDQNDRARLRFGNGILGTIPQGTITCSYKTGGGTAGNVDANTITRAVNTYTDEFGNPLRVTVTNPDAASGGSARQTVEAIRLAAPRSVRATTRSVTREDFEIHALKVPGVARALMLTKNEREAIAENRGQLVIVPAGGGLPSATLKAAVLNQVTTVYPKTLTFQLSVVDPTYQFVNVHARVFPRYGAGTTSQNAALDAAIRSALAAFFALELEDGSPNPTANFGYYTEGFIAFSDAYNVVRDVANVRRMGDQPADFLLDGQPSDVPILPHGFPQLGDVVLINGFTGLPLVA